MAKNPNTPVSLGLGDAILRLVRVEQMRSQSYHPIPEQLEQEREMILEALNQIQLDLGFDCNNDGVPDTVEIFEQSASTDCCRLLPQQRLHTNRISRKRTSSRKTKPVRKPAKTTKSR